MTPSLLTVWFEFGVCLLLIAFSGSKLSKYGDVIAEKTGLSGTWVGILMLATVTSLPELVTGLSSVILADAPDIAVGSILGSCIFNLSILVLLDFVHRRESVYTLADTGLILSAAYGLVLISFTGLSLLLSNQGLPGFGHIGISTPIIIAVYLIAMRNIFAYERKSSWGTCPEEEEIYGELKLSQAVIRYIAVSAIVVGIGIWLPFVGERLGEQMGWRHTFVGSLFIALATSLPEMVVTVAAARLGALDMAVGNLFGSNLFNILIIAFEDLAYTSGPLLANVSSLHQISAMSATMMTGLAVIGVFVGAKNRPMRTVGWVSIFLLLTYLLNSFVLYRLDRG